MFFQLSKLSSFNLYSYSSSLWHDAILLPAITGSRKPFLILSIGAPLWINSSAHSKFPLMTAASSGVKPSEHSRVKFAPFSIRICAHSTKPSEAASWIGSLPMEFAWFTLTFPSRSIFVSSSVLFSITAERSKISGQNETALARFSLSSGLAKIGIVWYLLLTTPSTFRRLRMMACVSSSPDEIFLSLGGGSSDFEPSSAFESASSGHEYFLFFSCPLKDIFPLITFIAGSLLLSSADLCYFVREFNKNERPLNCADDRAFGKATISKAGQDDFTELFCVDSDGN